MKKLTSFMCLNTGEGTRVSYTFSEIDTTGKIISQNQKENFVVLDETLQGHIDAIYADISGTLEGES